MHPPSNVVAQSHNRLRIRRFLSRHVGLDDMQFFQQIRRAVDPAESLRFGVQDPDVGEGQVLIAVREDQVGKPADLRFVFEPVESQERRIARL